MKIWIQPIIGKLIFRKKNCEYGKEVCQYGSSNCRVLRLPVNLYYRYQEIIQESDEF